MNSSGSTLLVAVATNDGKTVFPKMLGMAKYFYIYTTTDGARFDLVEKRTNPYETTMQHLKTLDVYAVINDCPVVIAAVVGKKGIERLRERGVRLFFGKGNIEEALTRITHED